jgi:S-adenosylmethionine synthetase
MYKTAESVSPHHPDKICDQISDSILDSFIAVDPDSRVAVECMGGHGLLTITGEVTSNHTIDIEKVARNIVGDSIEIRTNLVQQSPEIAQGVDTGGAGDQGSMVGYATSTNGSYIPNETFLARDLNKLIYQSYPFDGKTQITLAENKIVTVVASFQNAKSIELENIIHSWLSDKIVVDTPSIFTNPAGDWSIGGFEADAGLTGRKLAVDNYGPNIPLGGGCFSGKDGTKVDRSGAYMARRIALDYLQKTGAREVYCYLAYSIGVVQPVQATIIIDGHEERILGYDLSPQGIITFLKLRTTIFTETARWGHFGNGFMWG